MTSPEKTNTDSADTIDSTVSAAESGIRFDHFLVNRLANSSRNILMHSIRAGLITVDGNPKKSSYRLKEGEKVEGAVYCPAAPSFKAQEVTFPILYEDDDIIVISKPPGIVVHPAQGNKEMTIVNGLLFHCKEIAGVGDEARPGIVHRLDKDTSGVMVAAKTASSHSVLAQGFKLRQTDKVYLAIVRGIMPEKQGRLVANIARHKIHRKKMSVCEEGEGRYSVSNWQVLEEYGEGFSLVEVKIETGRTHQIRVHMAFLGYPVAGDRLYGRKKCDEFPRQMLHARKLGLIHPQTGEKMVFDAPLWPDFQRKVDELRSGGYTVPSVST